MGRPILDDPLPVGILHILYLFNASKKFLNIFFTGSKKEGFGVVRGVGYVKKSRAWAPGFTFSTRKN